MSFRYISFLCYNTFRYIKFLFLLFWAGDFLLYQFPFYCYIRIRYIRFRYINFLFLVISVSVISESVISISLFCYIRFRYINFLEKCYITFRYIKFRYINFPIPAITWFVTWSSNKIDLSLEILCNAMDACYLSHESQNQRVMHNTQNRSSLPPVIPKG